MVCIAACTKDTWHAQGYENVTMQTLAGDTGRLWQTGVMYWSVSAPADTINGFPAFNRSYESHTTQQTIKFKPDSSYQCSDSIAMLLHIPASGKFFVDTSYYIHINVQNSPLIETYKPTEGDYNGMLALSDDYTTIQYGSNLKWSALIWLKRVK
jgi:hypothetical protein